MVSLSIIVPVYNKEKYLESTLESLISQNVVDCEIILVDDGSTDNSPHICDEYKTKDNRIRVLHIPNQGVSNARNTGLNVSNGAYIAFMDADDLVDKRMYELMIDEIAKTGSDMSICGTKIIDLKGKTTYSFSNGNNVVLTNMEAVESFLNESRFTYGSCNKVYKRELIRGIKFETGRGDNEDKFFLLQAIVASSSVAIIGEPLFINRKTTNSITTSKFNKVFFDEIYFAEKINQIVKDNYSKLLELAIFNQFRTTLRVIRKICREKSAMKTYQSEMQTLINETKCIRSIKKPFRYKIESMLMYLNISAYGCLLRTYYRLFRK